MDEKEVNFSLSYEQLLQETEKQIKNGISAGPVSFMFMRRLWPTTY